MIAIKGHYKEKENESVVVRESVGGIERERGEREREREKRLSEKE